MAIKSLPAGASTETAPAETPPATTETAPAPTAVPGASTAPDDARKQALDSLTFRDLREHPEFKRALGNEVRAQVQKQMASADKERQRRELEAMPAEQRYVTLGREAEQAERLRGAQEGLYAEFQRQATDPLVEEGVAPALLEELVSKPNVGEFMRSAYKEAFKAGFEAAKKDKAVLEAIRTEVRNEGRKSEPTVRRAPTGQAGEPEITAERINAMSAKEFSAFERANPDFLKRLHAAAG